MANYDIVIRNGQVADGTGKKLYAADVGLKGDRIAAIEAPGALKGDNEIDATGKVVAPGFIDVHTHDDTALIDNPTMAMKASQGVTTVVCGNCGASAAPFVRDDIGHFLSLIVKKQENVSKSFAEFAGKVEAARPAINGAFLIGHSTLRMNALGNDLARQATAPEIKVMHDLLDQSLEQGAIGMSSGLFYPPAMAASTDEVAEVAMPLGKWGGVYTAHMRDEGDHILKSMDETFEIGRRAGAPVIVSHHKCSGRTNFGRMKETLPKFTEAMKQQDIAFDVYPYVAGSTILRKEMLDRADKVLITWSDTVKGVSGRDLKEIAAEMGCSIHDAADRLQPAGAIYFMMDEKDVQSAMAHPGAMIGSDGIPFDTHPHPRLWGTFPRVLGHYSRDLKLFPLEDAVRRMTSYSAQRFKLAKRGELKPGYYADICVFDPATVIDTATFEKPISPARGIDTVLCNGAIVWRDGKPGDGRAGRVLRRQELQAEK
ncbi:N-acyl-D-amino-acid deacylase family protein [Reyranella sp.]|uniref:N-acyl-D-amino-acid deacylase family protein n=1 Tax=Reyranella sp. TaxID=1929291 RepID=UPI003BACE2FD